MTHPVDREDSVVRIGSRGSKLALAQAKIVADRLLSHSPGRALEVVIVRTEGDVDKRSPLSEIGGRGVFTNALEAALLRGEIDAAVHSAKDLPTALHAEAPIVAIFDRVDPRDVLISREGVSLTELPPNPVIGTSSRRREVQIRRLRPDSRPINIRGNIDSRLRSLERGDCDAILLAAAGLHRLGWGNRITEYFSVEDMVPAPAQGALAVQARSESDAAAALCALDDPSIAIPVAVERAFLAALGAGCSMPVGALASPLGNRLRLRTMLATADGARIAERDDCLDPGGESQQVADIARHLQAQLGLKVFPANWPERHKGALDLRGARVVVTRPSSQARPLLAALADRGAEAIPFPTIRVNPLPDVSALDVALHEAWHGRFKWVVFTSVNAVQAVAARVQALGLDSAKFATVLVAAVGRSTAEAASRLGLSVTAVPEEATGMALAEELRGRLRAGDRVLYPVSSIGREELPRALKRLGAEVELIPVYATETEFDVDQTVLERIRQKEFDFVSFSSSSAVHSFARIVGDESGASCHGRAVCAGPVTANAARESGFDVVAVAAHPGAEGMADAVAACWRERIDLPDAVFKPGSRLERSAD